MLNRINWKAIFKGFAWIICLGGVVVLMSFIQVKKQGVKCSNVMILIPGSDNFIEREEIDAILKQGEGQLIGRNLDEINIHQIEKTIQANPYIAFAKVYTDMDGVIHIKIRQRQPILRVINAGGQDYYIDRNGLKMPMSPNFTANVLVANGNILEGFGSRVDTLLTPLAADLYRTALYIKQDSLWDAQIEQLFVNSKNEIELIPRIGNQRIILGTADSLATKMNNLLAFYEQAMPKMGWDTYRTINIKYTNQVIAAKNDSLNVKKAVIKPVDTSAIIKQTIDSALNKTINEALKKAAKPGVITEKTNVKPVGAQVKAASKPPLRNDQKSTEMKNKQIKLNKK